MMWWEAASMLFGRNATAENGSLPTQVGDRAVLGFVVN